MEQAKNKKTYDAALLCACLLLAGCSPCSFHAYRMPDGAICKERGGVGAEKFYDCDNGRTYVNPPYWTEVARKECR